jgi:hypothetical protein
MRKETLRGLPLKSWALPCAFIALGLTTLPANAQSLRIAGALSNFDCYNDNNDDADGFEIEVHGCTKDDVLHTWAGSAFGAPTVSNIGTSTSPVALVKYKSATGVVSPGAMTHFGVTLRNFPADPNAIVERWTLKHGGTSGVVLPAHQSTLVGTTTSSAIIRDTLVNQTNPDFGATFWIIPYANIVHRNVALEELMTDNPVVTESVPMGGGPDGMWPERLDPGDVYQNDDPVTSGEQSAIYSYDVFEDIVTYDIDGNDYHEPGRLIATVMDATISSATVPRIPQSITLAAPKIGGGMGVSGTVTLSYAAPVGGTVVNLSSDQPGVHVPATLTIPENQLAAQFIATTDPVTILTNANISASLNNVTRTAPLAVAPVSLSSLVLTPTSLVGGGSGSATFTLNYPAPAGMTISFVSSNPTVASVLANVTLAAGTTSGTISIPTSAVATATNVTISATGGGVTKSATLKVNPLSISAFTLASTTLKGGTSTTGTVTLSGPAPAGGVTVTFTSSSTKATVIGQVVIPAGATSAGLIPISTKAVTAKTTATITAKLGTTSKAVVLTITP